MYAVRCSDGPVAIGVGRSAHPAGVTDWLERAPAFEQMTTSMFGQHVDVLKLPDVLTTYTCGQRSMEEKSRLLGELVDCLFAYSEDGYWCPECHFEGVHLLHGDWWKCPSCGYEAKKDDFKVVPNKEADEPADKEAEGPELECPRCSSISVVKVGEIGASCNECGYTGPMRRFQRWRDWVVPPCPECRVDGVHLHEDNTFYCPSCTYSGTYSVDTDGIWLHDAPHEDETVQETKAEPPPSEDPKMECPLCHSADVREVSVVRSTWGCNECRYQGPGRRFEVRSQTPVPTCPECIVGQVDMIGNNRFRCTACEFEGDWYIEDRTIVLTGKSHGGEAAQEDEAEVCPQCNTYDLERHPGWKRCKYCGHQFVTDWSRLPQ